MAARSVYSGLALPLPLPVWVLVDGSCIMIRRVRTPEMNVASTVQRDVPVAELAFWQNLCGCFSLLLLGNSTNCTRVPMLLLVEYCYENSNL
jgi:hypothetical protein